MNDLEEEFNYCTRCAGALVTKRVKDGEPERLVCPNCGGIHYLDPKLAACAIIEINGGVVLVKRSINPGRGLWVIPGGFVDRGEPVPEAMVREVAEETGLKVEPIELFGLYSYPGETVAVAVYLARVLSGDLIAGDESSAAGLFGPDEIPWEELAFRSTQDSLTEYCRRRENVGT